MNKAITIILLSFCVAAVSCSKTSGPANGKSVQLNNRLDSNVSVSALINGQEWQTDSAYSYRIVPATNDSGAINVMITATKSEAFGGPSTFVLNISHYTGPNTYTINPPVNTATYYAGTQRHFATSGEIVVTSDSAYSLIGTFTFTADSTHIEYGAFNVPTP
jgi:hypothetical protein